MKKTETKTQLGVTLAKGGRCIGISSIHPLPSETLNINWKNYLHTNTASQKPRIPGKRLPHVGEAEKSDTVRRVGKIPSH